MIVAAAAQGRQLRLGVDGAQLRGVGNVHQFGGYHVLGVVGAEDLLHQGGGQFAVGGGNGADLVAGGLDGSGLVGVDVGGGGGDDRLEGAEGGVDHQQVGLGAAHGKVDVGVGCGAQGADQLRRLLTMAVQAVAAVLLQTGLRQCLQDAGMGGLAVIVGKAVHGGTS